jgi:glycosyltransferase involved in cell wall biosynthesis
MDKHRIVIIIPAYNESKTIKNIVKKVALYGVPIVIDDGSKDKTGTLALKAGAIVIKNKKKLGYDCALNSGFIKAFKLRANLVITIDADGQHDPLIIPKFIDAIISGADIVIGIRSRKQRFAEYLFAWYCSFRFGVRDPLCGFKAYRIELYKALGFFDSYQSIGTELMLHALKNGCKFSQIKFNVIERNDQPRFGNALNANCKIIRAMLLSIFRLR